VEQWGILRTAVRTHQKLLAEEGIGLEVNERDRVRVNARRVGLEAPLFADEAAGGFAEAMAAAFERRLGAGATRAEGEVGAEVEVGAVARW